MAAAATAAGVAVSAKEEEGGGAEKARQKAMARRHRILSQSAKRMDVVSGISSSPSSSSNVVMEGGEAATAANHCEAENEDAATANAGDGDVDCIAEPAFAGNSSKGARRVAAMRRRRYQNKKREGDDDDGKKEGDAKQRVAEDDHEEEQHAEPAEAAAENDEEESHLQTKEKKYMGVARMRRKIIKEARIAELEAVASDENIDPIDAAATLATIGMTASMIREDTTTDLLSDVAIKTLLGGKRNKQKWWKFILPPMELMPRIITLILLFMAGFDVGLEPHRMNVVMMSNATSVVNGTGAGGTNCLIHHVESSLGMGGKARQMMGMMDAAPPTSLPTTFSREEFCIGGGAASSEAEQNKCVSLSIDRPEERAVKEKLLLRDNDNNDIDNDEFGGAGNEDIISRPKGVSTSEFYDDYDDGKESHPPVIIDPIFRVDLDALLRNSQLPTPINIAAKFAIGFHRMWVRYLWTLPTSVLRSVLYSPKTLVDSWMANPPVFLFISLLIRMMTKLLLGNTSSLSEEDDEDGGGVNGKKSGSDNFDVLGKIKETAINYATSSFPKTILVLKTLKEVVTVDMYVILCGLLVGLVAPLVKQDLGFGGVSVGGGGQVLGDGEL